MKRIRHNFELIYAAGICLLLATPILASAQKRVKKEYTIEINNGDTVINGKKIASLSAKERKEAMDMIGKGPEDVMVRAKGPVRVERHMFNGPGEMSFNINTDSNRRVMVFRGDSLMKGQNIVRDFRFDFDTNDNRVWASGDGARAISFLGGKRSNTQSFSFSNVDKDGIETRMNFRVSDANAADAKKLGSTVSREAEPLISELVLYPDFPAGKVNMDLSMAGKTAASVELKNRDGKVFWNGRSTSGKLSASFPLPKNGLYFLVVKQGDRTVVKQFI
ncbi:MAG: T9SS type A sorting domain-containing protein, partial [Mucilaginibacter polytrichastri]|nr:T9SS type A sorting domain-containing protein [Mucilaginibacter polytrichastri]